MPALSWLWSIVSFVTGVLAGALYVHVAPVRLEAVRWFARHKPTPFSTDSTSITRRERKTSRRRSPLSSKDAGESAGQGSKKCEPSITPVPTLAEARDDAAAPLQPSDPPQSNVQPQNHLVTTDQDQAQQQQGLLAAHTPALEPESIIPMDAESRWRDHYLKRQWAESILQQTIEPSLSKHLRHAIKAVLHLTAASPETMDMIPLNPVSHPWESLMSPIVFPGQLGVTADQGDHPHPTMPPHQHPSTTAPMSVTTGAHHLARPSTIIGTPYTRPTPPTLPTSSVRHSTALPQNSNLTTSFTVPTEARTSQQQTPVHKSTVEPVVDKAAPRASFSASEPPVTTTTATANATAKTEAVSIQEQKATNRSSTTSSVSQHSTIEDLCEISPRPSSSSTDARQELCLPEPASSPSPPPLPPKDAMVVEDSKGHVSVNTNALANGEPHRQRQPQKRRPSLLLQQQHQELERGQEQEQDEDPDDDSESLAQDFDSVTSSNSPTRSGLRSRRLWSKVRQVVKVPDFGFGRKRTSGAGVSSFYQLGNGASGVVSGGKFASISDTHLPYNRNATFSFQLESAASSTLDLTAGAAGVADPTHSSSTLLQDGHSILSPSPQHRPPKVGPPPPLITDGLYLGWPGGSQRRISTVFETPPETADNSRTGSAMEIRPPPTSPPKPSSQDTGSQEYRHHHLLLPGLSRNTSTKAKPVAAETTTTIETTVSLVSVNECLQSSSVSTTTAISTAAVDHNGDDEDDGVERSVIQLQIQSPTSPATVDPFPDPVPKTSLLMAGDGADKDSRLGGSGGHGSGATAFLSPRPERGNSLDVPSSLRPTAAAPVPRITRKHRAMSVGQDLESYLSTRAPASTSTSQQSPSSSIERHYRQPSGQISGPPPSAGLDALKRLSRELAVAAAVLHDRSPSCPVSPRNSVLEPPSAPQWQPKDGVQSHRKDASSSYVSTAAPVLPSSKEERRLSALSFGGYFSSYGSGTSGQSSSQTSQQPQNSSSSWQSGSRMIPSLSSLALPSLPSFSPPKSDVPHPSGAHGLTRSTTRISDATIHQEGRSFGHHGHQETGAAPLSSGGSSSTGGGPSPPTRKLPPPLRIGGLHNHISAPSPILPPASAPFAFGGSGIGGGGTGGGNGTGGVVTNSNNSKMMTPMMMMMLSGRRAIPRMPISLDRYYYGVDQVHEWRIPSYGRVRFVDHAPQVFRVIRQRFGYELSDLDEALAQPFTVMTTPGKSDAIFFASHNNGRFLLKTLRGSEPDNLKQLLPDYVEHLQKHPNTLLPRYLGMFTFERLGGAGKGGVSAGGASSAQDGDAVGLGGNLSGAGGATGAGAGPTSFHQRSNSHRRQEAASTSHSTAKHLHMNGTLLTGLGRDDCLPSKVVVVVIANVFDTSSVVHERYDFKGSNVGRRTLTDLPPPNPAAAVNHDNMLASEAGPSRRWSTHSATGPSAKADDSSSQTRADISHLTLKEVDFQNRVLAGETQPIHLGPFMRGELLRQLEEDTLLLRKHGFMDYSMLVGIQIVPKKQPDPVVEASPETQDDSTPQEMSDARGESAEGKDGSGSLHTAESDDGEDDDDEEDDDEDEGHTSDLENDPPTALVTLLEALQGHLHTSYEYLTHTQQTAQGKVAEFWNAHKDLPWVQDLMSNAEATREWLQETKDKKKLLLGKKKTIDRHSIGGDSQGERHRESKKGNKSHRRSRRHIAQKQQLLLQQVGGGDDYSGFQTPSASRVGTLRGQVGGRSNQFSTVRAHGNPWHVEEEEEEGKEETVAAEGSGQDELVSALRAAMDVTDDTERQSEKGKTKVLGATTTIMENKPRSLSRAAGPNSGIPPHSPANGASSSQAAAAASGSPPPAPRTAPVTHPILPQAQIPPLPQSHNQRPIWSNGVPGVDLPDGTEVIYFFGLIDILQKYNLVKWLERNIKGVNVRLLGSSPPSAGIAGVGSGAGLPQSSVFHHFKEPSATGMSSILGGGQHETTNHSSLGSLSRLLPSACASEPSLPLTASAAAGGASSSPMNAGGRLSRSTSRTALGAPTAPAHHQYHHSRRTTGNLSTATQASLVSERDEGNAGSSAMMDARNPKLPGGDVSMAETAPAPTASAYPHPQPLGMPVIQPPTPTVASPHPLAAQFPQNLEVSVEEPGRYAERLIEYIRGATI